MHDTLPATILRSPHLDGSIRQGEIGKRISYCKETGNFINLTTSGKAIKGNKAGSVCLNGYLYIGVNRKKYLAHRLAWYFAYGEFPNSFIDHINGNPLDNRLVNLRLVDFSQNAQNMRKATKANKLGIMGAYKAGTKFEAKILVRGELHRLGIFATPEEANHAYLTAKRELHEACTI